MDAQLDEQRVLIDLLFKPNAHGLKFRPAEIQLLLQYIGEILKEIEVEEKLILEEEKAVKSKSHPETGEL